MLPTCSEVRTRRLNRQPSLSSRIWSDNVRQSAKSRHRKVPIITASRGWVDVHEGSRLQRLVGREPHFLAMRSETSDPHDVELRSPLGSVGLPASDPLSGSRSCHFDELDETVVRAIWARGTFRIQWRGTTLKNEVTFLARHVRFFTILTFQGMGLCVRTERVRRIDALSRGHPFRERVRRSGGDTPVRNHARTLPTHA